MCKIISIKAVEQSSWLNLQVASRSIHGLRVLFLQKHGLGLGFGLGFDLGSNGTFESVHFEYRTMNQWTVPEPKDKAKPWFGKGTLCYACRLSHSRTGRS